MQVVVYTTRLSPMFAELAPRWKAAGVTPVLVVVETSGPWWRRAISRLRRRADDSAALCRRLGWPFVRVTAVNDASALNAVKAVQPDISINAGAGILRKPILDVPRLGTLGAHMGLLPSYRGMNVAEWAALNGDPVGCSVFWIDEGIDTGRIVATHSVDAGGCRSIGELRARVNDAQLSLFAETSAKIVKGNAVGGRAQRVDEGRQFYQMHPDLQHLLARRLRAS